MAFFVWDWVVRGAVIFISMMCMWNGMLPVSVIAPNATMVVYGNLLWLSMGIYYGCLWEFIMVVYGHLFGGLHPINILIHADLSGEWETTLIEKNVLFNDALNTFYLRLYGVRHMVKDHSDCEKGNPLPPHRLLLSISSKGSFICTIPQTG